MYFCWYTCVDLKKCMYIYLCWFIVIVYSLYYKFSDLSLWFRIVNKYTSKVSNNIIFIKLSIRRF